MRISILTATLLAVIAATHAAQHPKIKRINNSRTVPGSYIIEFEDSYTGSHAQFLHNISSKFDNVGVSMRQSYDSSLFKGMSVKIDNTATTKDIATNYHAGSTGVLVALAENPQVRNIFPVSVIPRPIVRTISTSHFNSPQLLFAHNLTQVTEAHNYGYKGKGIIVGIIDTGKLLMFLISFN